MKKILFLLIPMSLIAQVQETICVNETVISIENLQNPRNYTNGIVYENNIYLFGGVNGSSVISNCDKYNPSTNSWLPFSNLLTARTEMGVAEVNGKVYCIGGWTGSTVSNKNEIYNISTNSWETKSNLPIPITSCDATTFDNQIYIFGGTLGETESYFYRYDPVNDVFTILNTPTQARSFAQMVTFMNKIYLIGGTYYNGGANFLNTLDVYDIESNTWSSLADLPEARILASSTIYDNKLYVFGGKNDFNGLSQNTVYLYDFALNSWLTLNNLPFAKSGMEACTYNDAVYLFGGSENGIGNNGNYLCYKYYCNGLLNIHSIYSTSLIQIYPNPAKSELNIETDCNIINIEIFDLLGKSIYNKNNPRKLINIDFLEKGMYVLKLNCADENYIFKFIKE